MFDFFSLITLFSISFSFFSNDTSTTEIYTLSLHDALPICCTDTRWIQYRYREAFTCRSIRIDAADRKSTRLNSSHLGISYAVFCLKKKNNNKEPHHTSQTKSSTQ